MLKFYFCNAGLHYSRLNRFRSPKTVLNPPVNGKFKDFSRPLSVFQVLFKASLIFKDFSRQFCIFKDFSSLCEPCPNKCIINTHITICTVTSRLRYFYFIRQKSRKT